MKKFGIVKGDNTIITSHGEFLGLLKETSQLSKSCDRWSDQS
jgi:hypothetical protein